jgi:hypothetical protein
MWIYSFSNTIYWRNYPFPMVCSWHLCWRSDDICVRLFFILFHWSMYLSLCQCFYLHKKLF